MYILVTLFPSCLPCYVRFRFCSTKPRDWLRRTSSKWPILCRVVRKTLTRRINIVGRRISRVNDVMCVAHVVYRQMGHRRVPHLWSHQSPATYRRHLHHTTGDLILAHLSLELVHLLPRLHNTTGCQTGYTAGLRTGWVFVYTMQPVVQPAVQLNSRLYNRFHNRLDVCIHDTTCCPSGYQTCLTTGCIV